MKKKMNIAIIITSIVLGTAVIAAAFYFILRYLKNSTVDKGGMINDRCLSCTYSISGGMEGESLRIILKEEVTDTAGLEVVSCEGAGAEEITKRYYVPFDALNKIYDLCRKYDVTKWGELPDSEIIALDAPTVSVSIETVNATVSFSSNKEFPKNSNTILSEIRSVLNECIEQAKSTEQSGTAE